MKAKSRTKRRAIRRLRRKAILLLEIIAELAFLMLIIAVIILGFRFAKNYISTSFIDKKNSDVKEVTDLSSPNISDGLQNIEIKEAHTDFYPSTTTTYITTNITTTTEPTTISTTVSMNEETTNYFSEYETRLFASLIEAEGGITPKITRERIGIACINRVASELFPNSIEEVISQPGQYETYIKGLLPENPSEENIEIASEIMGQVHTSSWSEYCISKKLSEKTVFQANSCIDQSGYAYTILDEYGTVGSYEYHMVYGESIYDYSDVQYSYDYVS